MSAWYQVGKGIAFGLLIIMMTVLVTSFAAATILSLTPIKELDMAHWLEGVTFIILLIGGMVGGAVSKRKGLIVGLVIGLTFFSVSLLLSKEQGIDIWLSSWLRGVLILFISMVGGIVGINLFGGQKEKKG
ncbi:TIGR04086 family membrane protein [Jeotgalibacillus soli]|uniref:TIGR04086 family membrane protein n=1 Tax=Jeotgalibacillus soli TaxID=889306 RepID=A0A0C2R2Q7_9BACL|nr:TIGR04086 family membrane protein [Jeotgalibacillus soli]KIL44530.1 hypothetical protein KP78_34940 [Jeotgalibacillus soli]